MAASSLLEGVGCEAKLDAEVKRVFAFVRANAVALLCFTVAAAIMAATELRR